MRIDWFAVTLRCSHPNWDPDDISSELGMEPTFSWKVGERRCTPKGQILDGYRRDSYWCSEKLTGFQKDPCQALIEHVEALERKRAFIGKFVADGGSIELFIGWKLSGPSGGEGFDAKTLKRLGDLGIDLLIDIYEHDFDESATRRADEGETSD